jgi:hypothetical protein
MDVIIIDHSKREWMPVCMSLMAVWIELSTAVNPESLNMEILDQKHWSPGRRWTS